MEHKTLKELQKLCAENSKGRSFDKEAAQDIPLFMIEEVNTSST